MAKKTKTSDKSKKGMAEKTKTSDKSDKNNVKGLIKLYELQGMINEAFGTVNVNKLEDFTNASPSMFEQSMSPNLFAKAKVEATPETQKVAADFMASTEHSWINNGSVAANILTSNTNPFLKGDSGFISPACQSNNQSASSEDSAENHDEREATSSMASIEDDERTLAKSPVVEAAEEDDSDETEEVRQVTNLLAGGIMETQFGELNFANRDTPTPPIEGSSLEEILAAARDQPDSVEQSALVEDVDSDETSSDASESEDKLTPDEPLVTLEAGKLVVADSDSDSSDEANGGDAFEFVKKHSVESGFDEKAEVILKSALCEERRQDSSSEDDDSDQEIEKVEQDSYQKVDEVDNKTILSEEAIAPEVEVVRKESAEPSAPPHPVFEHLVETVQQVPAVSVLNALDYPEEESSLGNSADDSAPSSLESQSGPASVIIESQEVPTPDSGSFILKTSEFQNSFDNLPTPQEPVVEVIPGAVEGSQSPILEENPEDINTSSEDSEEKSSQLLLVEENQSSERKLSESNEEKPTFSNDTFVIEEKAALSSLEEAISSADLLDSIAPEEETEINNFEGALKKISILAVAPIVDKTQEVVSESLVLEEVIPSETEAVQEAQSEFEEVIEKELIITENTFNMSEAAPPQSEIQTLEQEPIIEEVVAKENNVEALIENGVEKTQEPIVEDKESLEAEAKAQAEAEEKAKLEAEALEKAKLEAEAEAKAKAEAEAEAKAKAEAEAEAEAEAQAKAVAD
jgi:hypothetical protein